MSYRDPQAYRWLQIDVTDTIGLITLNRPPMNADDGLLEIELADAVTSMGSDDDVRVIITTGAGKAYCAGADLSPPSSQHKQSQVTQKAVPSSTEEGGSFAQKMKAKAHAQYPPPPGFPSLEQVKGGLGTGGWDNKQRGYANHRDGGGRLTLCIHKCPKPFICAINGAAVGVGISHTLAADIRIVAEDAKIGFVFNRRGITPDAMASYNLPKLVGPSKALELLLTARVFIARDEAHSGLFTYVLPKDEVLTKAIAIAKEICQNSPIAGTLTKALVRHPAGSMEEHHLLDSKCLYWTGQQVDAHEGVLAFQEKRAAQFPGKPSDVTKFPVYPWWADVDARPKL